MTLHRPHFVLLPGLDGTGYYSRLLEQALKPHARVTSLSFPRDIALDYEALVERVERELPSEPHVIIAESFSGPLALLLASRKPQGLAGLVLGSTFACIRWPWKRMLLAMARHVPPGRLPTSLTSRLVWGNRDSVARRNELREVMAGVSPEVVSLRNCEALQVDRREGPQIELPALLMRGRHDRLIDRRSFATLGQVLTDYERVDFDAPHFLFQAEPDATAQCILGFVRRRVFPR